MAIESLTLLFLLILCLIMGIALVIVIQDLFRMEKKLQKSEEENLAFKNALQQEADIVLEEANKRAEHVIDEANHKAMEIVSSSQQFNEEAQKELQQELATVTKAETAQIEQIGQKMATAYEHALQGVQEESNKIVHNITEGIEHQAETEVNAFAEALKKETIASEQQVRERIQQEYQAANQEIQAYKEQQMKKAQEEIVSLVKLLTEAALGKGLTIDQHQTLVMEALEEARAQGVIK